MPTFDDRPLPGKPELEREILGAILLDPSALDGIRPLLDTGAKLSSTANQAVYDAMLHLADLGAPVDLTTVIDTLETRRQLDECGGRSYVGSLMECAATSVGADVKAGMVLLAWQARQGIQAGYALAARMFEVASDPREALGEAATALAALAATGAGREDRRIGDGILDTVNEVQAAMEGTKSAVTLDCGLPDLAHTLPLRQGEVVVVAARPGVGKTAFALQVVLYLGRGGVPCGFVSVEMPLAQLRTRALLNLAQISLDDVSRLSLSNSRWSEMLESAKLLADVPVWVNDSPRQTVTTLAAAGRRMVREHAVRLLVVDYLQLVRPTRHRQSREPEVAEVSSGLKALARELSIPVMVLAQLNRQADEKPRISHLRESGAIEADADIIALLHVSGEDAASGVREIECTVGKHRNGPTGKCTLLYWPGQTRFACRARVSDDDVPAAQRAPDGEKWA